VIRVIPINTVTKELIASLNLLFSKRNKKASSVAARAGVDVDFGDRRIDQLAPGDVIKLAEMIGNVRTI
jgi:hypothetical protein